MNNKLLNILFKPILQQIVVYYSNVFYVFIIFKLINDNFYSSEYIKQ